jgi:hypothetical protein
MVEGSQKMGLALTTLTDEHKWAPLIGPDRLDRPQDIAG